MSDTVTISEAAPLTQTVECSMAIPAHRNLFRFMDGARLGAKWKCEDGDVIDLTSLSEPDFDLLDITLRGIPTHYCVLAPGLGVMWPTPAEGGVITVFIGASDE